MPSSAPTVFQWSLIRGIEHNLCHSIRVVNVLPIGTWPNYADIVLKAGSWDNNGSVCQQIGSVNLPFVKQLQRAIQIRQYLRQTIKDHDEVVVYSTYLPFLWAIRSLPSTVKTTLIVTDLPEYYDLDETGTLRRFLRKVQNTVIYKCLSRVDRYILLTEKMAERLPVGSKPVMVMEGLYQQNDDSEVPSVSGRPIIFYSGTLRYVYGIRNLLDAFQLLGIPDAELWICGSGEAEAEIRKMAEADNRIRFYGFCTREEVAHLRKQAAVLVNPRPNEGDYTKYSFPSKTMEYMASGRPVVMYKLDGVPEEYDDYLFLVDGADAASLAREIRYVLEHPAEAQNKASAARAFILKNKTADAQALRMLDLLET